MIDLLRRFGARLAALIIVVALYGFARLPEIDHRERSRLAEKFRFERVPFPDPPLPSRRVRPVHPDLERISAWISSVGAAVALNDLDGDGLSNDACLVDVRTDEVSVAPVPGTGNRFARMLLKPDGLPFDAATMAPMGCLPGDVNEDGKMDLLVYYWGRTPVLFVREGAAYRPQELVTTGERWFTNAATFADLDGDGHADLVIGNYFQDGAEILDAIGTRPQTMQHSMSRALNAGRSRIFLWAGPGQFRNASSALSDDVAHGWTLAIGAADLDGDLLPELYFGHDFGPDRLLHNRSTPGHLSFAVVEGRKGFTTPNSKVLGRDSYKGMGVDFADVNGDGLLDIYVSNIAAPYALEESHLLFISTGHPEQLARGIAPYVDRSEPLGLSRSSWSWDARLADFDNDGIPEAMQAVGFVRGDVNRWPELHEIAMGNDQFLQKPSAWHRFRPGDDLSGHDSNPFFVRASDGRYYDLAEDIGIGQPQVARGIAIADVDGDGKLDFAVANQWDTSYFYRNSSAKSGAALSLRVVHGNGSPWIGAEARVTLARDLKRVAQVDGGSGHSGKRSPDLHFGIGNASQPVPVEFRWRDATGIHTLSRTLPPGRHTVMLGGAPQ